MNDKKDIQPAWLWQEYRRIQLRIEHDTNRYDYTLAGFIMLLTGFELWIHQACMGFLENGIRFDFTIERLLRMYSQNVADRKIHPRDSLRYLLNAFNVPDNVIKNLVERCDHITNIRNDAVHGHKVDPEIVSTIEANILALIDDIVSETQKNANKDVKTFVKTWWKFISPNPLREILDMSREKFEKLPVI